MTRNVVNLAQRLVRVYAYMYIYMLQRVYINELVINEFRLMLCGFSLFCWCASTMRTRERENECVKAMERK